MEFVINCKITGNNCREVGLDPYARDLYRKMGVKNGQTREITTAAHVEDAKAVESQTLSYNPTTARPVLLEVKGLS